MINYPSVGEIISTNEKVLEEIRIRKSDHHDVLGEEKIERVLAATRKKKGDVYDKAVVLLKGLAQSHPFASGNRRTAFVSVENFLLYNGKKPKVNKDTRATVMQGIREGYYSDKEIRRWLEGGDIHEFKR
jgi:death-on-curing family protein